MSESAAVQCLAEMAGESGRKIRARRGRPPKIEHQAVEHQSRSPKALLSDHDYVEGEVVDDRKRNKTFDGAQTPQTPIATATAESQGQPVPFTVVQNLPGLNLPPKLALTLPPEIEFEGSKFEQPWTTTCGVWKTPYKGYFSGNDNLNEAVKIYTEETGSRWVVTAKDKLFSSIDIKLGNFKLFWRGKDGHQKAAVFPDFDGIPFITIGRKSWGCHLGRDKCRSGKIKYRTRMQEESQYEEGADEKWPLIRSSKKLGCPAMLSAVHVLKFRDYRMEYSISEFHRKQMLKSLRQSLLSKHNVVNAEQRFYIQLAEPDQHIHNTMAEDSTSPNIQVDRRIIYKITHLHHQGMFRLADISRELERYVKGLYTDPPPRDLFPELYPTFNSIHFHVSQAVKVTSLLEMDLGRSHRQVSAWQAQYPGDSWYYQPFASSGPIKRAKKKSGQHLQAGQYPDLTQTFLFCCQNERQRYLLNMYGSVCVLDSPKGKTALPMYFLQVRTNVGYQIVCTIIMQYWCSRTLAEVLQVVREWNIDWQPKAIVVGFIEEDVDALETIFPDCQIAINCIHQGRFCLDCPPTLNCDQRYEETESWIKSVMYAKSQQELEETLFEFQQSTEWEQNGKLRYNMINRWLPCIKRWSFAYLSKHLLVTMFANGGLRQLQEALSYDWLPSMRSRSLSELLTSLVLEELPKLYENHCALSANLANFNRYQTNRKLPVYVRHQPPTVLPCLNQSQSTMEVTMVIEGNFVVTDNRQIRHRVSFGNDTVYPECDCWSGSLGNLYEICEHFRAVFHNFEDWHWCQLSPLYTGSPIFSLESPSRDMPRCGSDGFELAAMSENDFIQVVNLDDFGATEIVTQLDETIGGDEDSPAEQPLIAQKKTACKGLLVQLEQLTKEVHDPEAMDYMADNLVVLLKEMQRYDRTMGSTAVNETKKRTGGESVPEKHSGKKKSRIGRM